MKTKTLFTIITVCISFLPMPLLPNRRYPKKTFQKLWNNSLLYGAVRPATNGDIQPILYQDPKEQYALREQERALTSVTRREEHEENLARRRDDIIKHMCDHVAMRARISAEQRAIKENFYTLLDSIRYAQKYARKHNIYSGDLTTLMIRLANLCKRTQAGCTNGDEHIKDMYVTKKMSILTDAVYASLYKEGLTLENTGDESTDNARISAFNNVARGVNPFVDFMAYNSCNTKLNNLDGFPEEGGQ